MVRYEISGTGEPLVLIHGFEADRRQYAGFAPALGYGIRAINYDQRDTAPGDVLDDEKPYDVGDLADDVASLLDTLDLPTAHVLGSSFGGAIAQHVALRHPDRVRTLTLVATTARFSVPAVPGARTAAEQAAYMLDAAVSPAARETDPAIPDRVRAALVTLEPEQRTRRMQALRTHDATSRLHEIGFPTLVIHGTDDPIVSYEAGENLASLIPGARFVPYDGGRHGLVFEFQDRLAAEVSAFVLSQAGNPAG